MMHWGSYNSQLDNLLYVFDGCVERDSPTKGPDNDGLGAQHHLQDAQLSDQVQVDHGK